MNCMSQLQRIEKSRPAFATETLVSTESLIVTQSAEGETWTETETSTASYDKGIREVEQEEPVPPLVYPVLTKNMTSRKQCIFEACTVTTKKLREHVERTHIPWGVSRQCLDLEKAKQFLKLLGKELGAHSFREFLRIIV